MLDLIGNTRLGLALVAARKGYHLLPIFEKGWGAVVVDRDHLLGVITRIDLVNNLRQRAD